LYGRLALGAATTYRLSCLCVRYITGFAVVAWAFALALTFGKETMRQARSVAFLAAGLALLAVILWVGLRPHVELRFGDTQMVSHAGPAFHCALASGVLALLVLLGDEALLVAEGRADTEAVVVPWLALGARDAKGCWGRRLRPCNCAGRRRPKPQLKGAGTG
jgi:hypothetical protein